MFAFYSAILRLGGVVLETEVVRVQELGRFSLTVLELTYGWQTDRSKHGANGFDLGMFAPNRLRQRFHQMFPQDVVGGAPDRVQQTGYAQAGRGAADRWQLVFHSAIGIV